MTREDKLKWVKEICGEGSSFVTQLQFNVKNPLVFDMYYELILNSLECRIKQKEETLDHQRRILNMLLDNNHKV